MRTSTSILLALNLTVAAFAQRDLKLEPLTSLPTVEKRWALLIGVDRYDDEQLSGLDGASNDAKALARTLVERAGFREEQVVILGSDQPVPRKPTRAEILFRLGNILKQVPKDGLFLLSFSGHGMERGGHAFLLPSDARLSDDPEILGQVSLDVATLRGIIARQGIQQAIVLLDACRNDPGGRAESANPLTESYVRGFNFDVANREVQAFATLYSTAVGDRAWEYKEKKQGYFSWAITEGLKGRAANEDGKVTLASLIRFVQDSVPRQVALDLGPSKRQRPFAQVEGYRAEDLVLGVMPRRQAAIAAPVLTDDEAIYWRQCESRGDGFCRIYLERFPAGRFVPLAQAMAARKPPVEEPAPQKAPVNQPVAQPIPQPVIVEQPRPAIVTVPSLRQARETWRNPKDKQNYVWVPAGAFRMGCKQGEPGCQSGREVAISRGFWLGQTEVTVEAYRRYREAAGAPMLPQRNKNGQAYNEAAGDDKLPAVAMTFAEAEGYCTWAGLRLPTDAEWEYAARAGGPRSGSLGDSAWYADNSGRRPLDSTSILQRVAKPEEYFQQLVDNANAVHRVATRQPNSLGLNDMLGNVDEWVAESPTQLSPGNTRTARGGSWMEPAARVGVVARVATRPDARAPWHGFRCAGEPVK
ncbi:MAG: SUMF1/EgtB/PvdO family nonheme iron enzyme [Bryobacteraceae bacterium]